MRFNAPRRDVGAVVTPASDEPTFPEEPHEIPSELINHPQDCIDFGTVRFRVNTVIEQGAKRAVTGECVVTGRQFEAVYLHRNTSLKDSEISDADPLCHFQFDRVWQYRPEKIDVELRGVYGQLREKRQTFGRNGTAIGPTKPVQVPGYEALVDRFEELTSTLETETNR